VTSPFDPAYGDVVEAPTVSPDFSVEEFLAWVRTKPASAQYNYYSTCGCALGQFCEANGFDWAGNGKTFRARNNLETAYREQLNGFPWTFGALAARLEALTPTIAYRGRVG
jgi:hypothetical protein